VRPTNWRVLIVILLSVRVQESTESPRDGGEFKSRVQEAAESPREHGVGGTVMTVAVVTAWTKQTGVDKTNGRGRNKRAWTQAS
jgi:hypothetical protein